MNDSTDPHSPTPEFRAALKRELRRSFRADLQFGVPRSTRSGRLGLVLGIAAGALITLTLRLAVGASGTLRVGRRAWGTAAARSGGGCPVETASANQTVQLGNQLTWYSLDNTHTIRVASSIAHDAFTSDVGQRLSGSFVRVSVYNGHMGSHQRLLMLQVLRVHHKQSSTRASAFSRTSGQPDGSRDDSDALRRRICRRYLRREHSQSTPTPRQRRSS